MPLDTASVRMERLNSLMLLLLQDKENTKSRLISILEYQTTRTLERDIQLLRDRYGVEITYDARKKTYQCKDAGQFMLRFSLTKPEVIALAAGLKMAKHFLPHLQSSADAIWEKTARLMPEELLEEGKQVTQETRRWDDNKEYSYSMRSKEDAQDYRYFPDPDLVPLEISEEWIAKIKEGLPEFRTEKMKRYRKNLTYRNMTLQSLRNGKRWQICLKIPVNFVISRRRFLTGLW